MLVDDIKKAPPAYVAAAVRESQLAALKLTVGILEGVELIPAPHHEAICNFVDDVFNGKIKRGIINLPPGYGKTINLVWALIARGFVVNPRSRFIHSSYSAELVMDNSSKVKDILLSEEFQYFNQLELKTDTKSKGLWRTDKGGGMRATQFGGGITGFRAGQAPESNDDIEFIAGQPDIGFSGAIILDDALKPADASSRKITSETNNRYNNTFASRLFHEDVPVILIMQRLVAFNHQPGDDLARCGDMSEFLLRGGSGEIWDHLILPVEVDNSLPYPKEWDHGRPYPHGLPDGPLWPFKHNKESIARLKRADPYVYAAQYAQRPKKRTSDPLIEGAWFKRYSQLPPLKRVEIFADTASKTKEANDYSVFLAAGECFKGNLYVIDLKRGKWTVPKLLPVCADFWNKHKSEHNATRLNIEDKSSGTFLVQSMEEKIGQSVVAVQRNTDKFTRVSGVLERISSGRVYLPDSASWVSDLVDECEDFTATMDHDFDDQVDTLCDAIEKLVMLKPVSFNQQKTVGGW